MDEFGVLVESIGFKAQRSSAPMAKLKSQPKPKQPSYQNDFPTNIAQPQSKPMNADPLFVDDLDGIFRSNTNANLRNNSDDLFGGNAVFGGAFSNTKPSGAGGGIGLDDLFVASSNSKGSSSLDDDFLMEGIPKNDNFFGFNSNSSANKLGGNGSGFDDLIPGFGQSHNGAASATSRSPQSSAPPDSGTPSVEDPLSVFESFLSHRDPEQSSAKSSSSIDELEDFAMGRSSNYANGKSETISKEAVSKIQERMRNVKVFGDKPNASSVGNIKVSFLKKNGEKTKIPTDTSNYTQTGKDKMRTTSNGRNTSKNEDDLDAIFSIGGQKTNVRRMRSTNEFRDPMFDALFNGKGEAKVEKTSPISHSNKAPSTSNSFDDFSFFFGEPASSAVEFQEIDGEPDERRKARFNNHVKTKERMAKALEEKNQRDLQAQREQDEKRRLAETLDADIKRWAAGKEGNLRALLSSLQYVLWSECAWQPVSLTDLITSTSVKKAYLKATLYVHPDKVQQKGAREKFIAERVFDLLKEAWNKFNAEELR